MPIAPYGGTLVDRRVAAGEIDDVRSQAASLKQVDINSVALSDLYLIGVGAFSPLEGFMGSADYEAVVDRIQLANGLPWSIPITLPVSAAVADTLTVGETVALRAPDGELAGLMEVSEIYGWNPQHEAERVYGTTDRAHPGVARLFESGERLLAGSIRYAYTKDISGSPEYNKTPAETRAEFESRGWKTVVAFQTRNPVHRAHEYLQ
jgi:sulfate adenylyltransferase